MSRCHRRLPDSGVFIFVFMWSALALVGVLSLTAGLRGAEGNAEVQKLLDAAYDSFQQGNLEAASTALQDALKRDPSSEDAYLWIDRVGYLAAVKMLESKHKDLARAAGQIMRLSQADTRRRQKDPDAVAKAIEEIYAASDQPAEEYVRRKQAVSAHGRYLVPSLVERLGSPDVDTRATAIRILREVGVDAVLPLIAASEIDNPMIRQNVAIVLGKVRHRLGLATLKAFAEADPDPEVKRAAAESIKEIALGNPSALTGAKELFVADALRYFRGQWELPHRYYEPVVWRLGPKGTTIVAEEVAAFQVPKRIAEAFLRRAVRLDSSYAAAQALLAGTLAAQVAEYRTNMDRLRRESGDEEAIANLRAQGPVIEGKALSVRGRPNRVLHGALEFALVEPEPETAVVLLQTLRQKGIRGAVDPSLSRALVDSDPLVRYHAALAIAGSMDTIGPGGFENSDRVIRNLSDALVQSGARLVLIIADDQNLIEYLQGVFRSIHFHPFGQKGSARGLDRAKRFPPKDLIVVDSEVGDPSDSMMADPPAVTVVRNLRRNPMCKETPILVTAPRDKLEKVKSLFESGEEKVVVVEREVSRVSLRDNIVGPLFAASDDVKKEAERLAQDAAETLLGLAGGERRLPVGEAVQPLQDVLENRPDPIRIPAVRALGLLRVDAAIPLMIRVFTNAENSVGMRIAAMEALGDAIGWSGKGIDAYDGLTDAIRAGLGDTDAGIRAAAARALGNGEGAQPALDLLDRAGLGLGG